jgi:hypothetical protein
MNTKRKLCAAVALAVLAMGSLDGNLASASAIIADGEFSSPIGTVWRDATGVGITTQAAPGGIPGNYASLPNDGDLYQYFSGPGLGTYSLLFYIQNESPWPVELTVALQNPGGGIPPAWLELAEVIRLPGSMPFTPIVFPVGVFEPSGTLTEITFSNSYDNPHSSGPGLYWPGEGSINPPGTIINVAEVLLTPGSLTEPGPVPGPLPDGSGPVVPEPATWVMVLIGFAGIATWVSRRDRKSLVVS